jgi:rhodanese-related sulfurtransferase
MNSARVDDVPVADAWERLKSDRDTVLIDVRTRSEWAFVGLPDLSQTGKRVLTIEWQTFPDNRIDPAFATKLTELLTASGVGTDSELFFICRSGSRSRAAAEAMVASGFARCHNVADGFEGPLDADRHRGRLSGWKAAGLPWVQG